MEEQKELMEDLLAENEVAATDASESTAEEKDVQKDKESDNKKKKGKPKEGKKGQGKVTHSAESVVDSLFKGDVATDSGVVLRNFGNTLIAVDKFRENEVRTMKLEQTGRYENAIYRPQILDSVSSGIANLLLDTLKKPVYVMDPVEWYSNQAQAAGLVAASANRLLSIAAAPLGANFTYISELLATTTLADALNSASPDSINTLIQDTLSALPRSIGQSHVLQQFGTYLYNSALGNTFISTIFENNDTRWRTDALTQIADLTALAIAISGQRDQDYMREIHVNFPHLAVLIEEGRVSSGLLIGDLVDTGTFIGALVTDLTTRYLGVQTIDLENSFTLQQPSINLHTVNSGTPPSAVEWLYAVAHVYSPNLVPQNMLSTYIQDLIEDTADILRLRVYSALSTGNSYSTPSSFTTEFARDSDVKSAIAKRILEVVASFSMCKQAAVQMVCGTILQRLQDWGNIASANPDRLVFGDISVFDACGFYDMGSLIPMPSEAGIIGTINCDLTYGTTGPVALSPYNDKGYVHSAQTRSAWNIMYTINERIRNERLWEMTITRVNAYINEILSGYTPVNARIERNAIVEAPVVDGLTVGARSFVQKLTHTEGLQPVFVSDSLTANTGQPLTSHFGLFALGNRYGLIRAPFLPETPNLRITKSSPYSLLRRNPSLTFLPTEYAHIKVYEDVYSMWAFIIASTVGSYALYPGSGTMEPFWDGNDASITLPITLEVLKLINPALHDALNEADPAYLALVGIQISGASGIVSATGQPTSPVLLQPISVPTVNSVVTGKFRQVISYNGMIILDSTHFIRAYDVYNRDAAASRTPTNTQIV